MPRSKDKEFDAFLARAGGAAVSALCPHAWDYPGPLSDAVVAALSPPRAGYRVKYDASVKGFGARVTAACARSFVLNYRAGRRERRITIGSFPDWHTEQARAQAALLRRQVDVGEDPMAERHAVWAAPLVNELIERFEAEHIARKRPGTRVEYRRPLRLHVRPLLGRVPVADVTHADIEKLHRRLVQNGTPSAANRAIAVLGKMFALAMKWGMRGDNPARGIERIPEHPRERYLSAEELSRLGTVLERHPERRSANAVRLLLLTGARRNEVLGATWEQFDLSTGTWTKPHTATKQAKLHRVPLSPQAVALLAEMRKADAGQFLFPGQSAGKPLAEIKRFWAAACRQAGIEGARLHDLRHTYASVLASSGLSLPIIGALLGHSQAATTQRYAHLMDDPLRQATTLAARVITGDTAERR
jgi:integrase